MLDLATQNVALSTEFLGGLGEWWLRGSLVVVLAMIVARWTHRGCAATRHAVWAGALISCLVLPLVGSAFSWSVEVPWLVSNEAPLSETRGVVVEPDLELKTASTLVTGSIISSSPSAGRIETARVRRPGQASQGSEVPTVVHPVEVQSMGDGSAGFGPWWALVLAAIWSIGVGVRVLLRGRAVRRRFVIARQATRVQEGPLFETLQEAKVSLGVRRTVRLLQSEAIEIPVTWGTLNPVVLMPLDAENWAPTRRRHVLLHELSHVRRYDGLVQSLVWFVMTLRWFDPLAWYASTRLKAEAEFSCDDAVLLAGGRPATYAGHLLEIARTAGFGAVTAAAIAMARRRGALSNRIEAILDGDAVRRPVGLRRSSWVTLVTLLFVGLVGTAAVRPRPAPPAPPAAPTPLQEPSARAEAQPVVAPSPEVAPQPMQAPEPSNRPRSVMAPQPMAEPQPKVHREPAPAPAAHLEPRVPSVVVPRVAPSMEPVPVVAPEPKPAPTVREPGVVLPTLQEPAGPLDPVVREPVVAPAVTSELAPLASIESFAAPPAPALFASSRDEVWSYFREAADRGECRGGLFSGGTIGTSIKEDGDELSLEIFQKGCKVNFTKKGTITFAADDQSIARLGRGARLQIGETTRRTERSLNVSGGSQGEPIFDYLVNGEPRSEAEARQWIAELLPAVFRRSGFFAEERVSKILETQGVGGVLKELDLLATDYVVRVYVQELLDQATLSPPEMSSLLNRVSSIESDYELAEILSSLEPGDLVDPAVRLDLIRTARSIESDYELRRVVSGILDQKGLSEEAIEGLLVLAGQIESDYELAEVLIQLLGQRSLSSYGAPLVSVLETLESDYELTRVLKRAVEKPDLENEELIALLEVSRLLDSDYELAEFLTSMARRHKLEEPVAAVYREIAQGIQSSSEASRVGSAI